MIEIKTNALAGWNLDNSYTALPEIFFRRMNPTLVRSPELVI